MTADIIKLDDRREIAIEPGNGARQAIDLFMDQHMLGPQLIAHSAKYTLSPCDYMLAWLWQEGFKIVPLDGNE